MIAARPTRPPVPPLVNFMIYELLIARGDAVDFFARYGNDADRAAVALINATEDAFPRTPQAALHIRLQAKREAIAVQRHLARHTPLLQSLGVTRAQVARVTQMEWCAFPQNPFVLVAHGIKHPPLVHLPEVTNATKRYGIVLGMLSVPDRMCISRAAAYAEFTQNGLAHNDDFLEIDPSFGLIEQHPLHGSPDATFTDAKIEFPSMTLARYNEYQHLRNNVVESRGAFWLRTRLEAETKLPLLIAAMCRGPTL